MNTYERMFHEDIREKKKAGRGVFSQKGRGVKHTMRGIKTPYDFMSTKEKKKLNSEVIRFNMYETILTKEEFDLKDKETQKTLLTRWRELYENRMIMEQMGIKGNNSYHKLLKELEIPPKRRGGARTGPRKQRATANIDSQSPGVKQQLKEIETAVQQAPIKLIINGLHLEYNGTYDSDQLAKIFTKLQLLVDGETSDYYLTLTLTEEPSSRREKEKDKEEEKEESKQGELF